ncbi:magnesium transporter CorA [Sphingobacterium sp. SRCM116780]|uniref:CorA family divalent cation transporter n=1 Tax=Sphingobacterium sp. SRCM116780 TaxID=2907623 RepID=UPI001F16A280|nr:CorA family divalent cation transporter [Sphingobacterium sp. SRCM116780]UIR56488.1 magnesium transporter CorA [Sphingobacterium sp. SRCM116780]
MISTLISKEQANYEWIDVFEPSVADLEILKEKYNLNQASIKDSLEPEHLPKIEEFENYTFIILRLVSSTFKDNSDNIGEITDRLTIFYGSDFVITLHKKNVDFIHKIKLLDFKSSKLKDSRHLATHLSTAAIATFEKLLPKISIKLDEYEEAVFLTRQKKLVLKHVYFIKRQIDVVRKVIILYKEIVDHFHSSPKRDIYSRDLKDLFLRANTLYDNLSENTSQLLNIYFNISSNHTNEIMRILTIFSVFFMPITFVAGVYGMNFKNMPELEWYYGYPIAIGIMLGTSIAIYYWFKRKGWL